MRPTGWGWPGTRERLWTRDFILITLANLCNAVGFYFFLPTLPAFVLRALAGDQVHVGYALGLFTAAAVLARPLAGYLLDARGRRPVLLPALAGFATLAAAHALVGGLRSLYAVRILHGFFWGAVTTAAGTVAADVVAASRRGEGIGYFGLSMTVGIAIGPALGLSLLGEGRYGLVFGAAALASLAALVLASVVRCPPVGAGATAHPGDWRARLPALLDRDSLPLGVLIFLVMLTYGGVVAFVTVHGAGLGVANAGLFFVVYALFLTATRPLAGTAFDRRGPEPVVVFGLLAMIAGLGVLGGWRSPSGFFLAAPLLGLGLGSVLPAGQAMAVNQVAPWRRGAANATVMTALDLGIGLGAVAAGWVARRLSIAAAYQASAAVLLVPLAYFFLFLAPDYRRKVEARRREETAALGAGTGP